MRDMTMLGFLAAVQTCAETSQTLMRATGLDPLELQVAVSCAQERNLIEVTGKIHPPLRITADGWDWLNGQLAPYAALIRIIAPALDEVA